MRDSVGKGEVIDIEREVKLGGALHSKGVLIISSFLAARFAKNQPLSLAASLVLARIPTLVSILLTIGWPRTPLFMRVGKHSRR